MTEKLDYKEAYLTMMRVSEQAIRNLETLSRERQRSCWTSSRPSRRWRN